mmetsp:Transcript_36525/g.42441  ORF Transcript_36525/g.42441 Transcript_36525/m.42441 type:complete len:239 (-) Transcript_36525:49-765(-)|eukprot:CAMPEP_0194367206 /NCGR_PEP_ID=MMETSP0174-20130528/15253_1 /TAXON_ID=216777 /ORGANISM="Proboscia alata, Strain PI-D3" /LENGTH=238 /DNA_ID=CAMNT_0039142797 /DNA_START=136 /DNA_END=852 /DNA_ORIENTATION=-
MASNNELSQGGSAGTMMMLSGVVGSVKDKWNASGGNEAVAKVSDAIPQQTKDYLSEAKKKLFNPAHIRNPKVYFGIGEEKPYFIESNIPLLLSRVQHNLAFFYLNYAIQTAILFVLTLLISPGAIIGMGLLGLLWAYVVRVTSEGSVEVRGITISQKTATYGMMVLSACVLYYVLSHVFWWTLSTSGILIGLHSLLRDASMHKDEEDKVVMSGDFSGDVNTGSEGEFLNPGDTTMNVV